MPSGIPSSAPGRRRGPPQEFEPVKRYVGARQRAAARARHLRSFGCGQLEARPWGIGREEEVLFLADDLSFGPIDPGDVRQRTQWAVDELGFHEDAEIASRIEEFWERVIALRTEIVAWVSTRYVTEYCGLLELLWRVKDAPVSVVDVADVAFTRRDGTPSPDTSTAFACVPEEQIVQRRSRRSADRRRWPQPRPRCPEDR